MVRVLMAQNVLHSLKNRARSMKCPHCSQPGFDGAEAAYVPALMHVCPECGGQYSIPGKIRKTVANPLPAILVELAKFTQRPPQIHRLNLEPENL